MKTIKTFEEFVNEHRINESWPFDNKKHVSKEEEMAFYKLLKNGKTDILYNNDEKNTGTVKDKRFQTDNVEKAWELFEIWASLHSMTDLRMYLQEYTWTPHDDIFDPKKSREMGELGTNFMLDMLRKRSDKDVKTLKKMGFLI